MVQGALHPRMVVAALLTQPHVTIVAMEGPNVVITLITLGMPRVRHLLRELLLAEGRLSCQQGGGSLEGGGSLCHTHFRIFQFVERAVLACTTHLQRYLARVDSVLPVPVLLIIITIGILALVRG